MVSRKSRPLIEMISPKTTALNVDVANWEDAIKVSGNLLEKAGFVDARYTQAMIDSVKDLGPYVVIAPGVAMPHARPEDGVLEPCMSLVTLKEPVNFGNKNNDPVKIVISFGTIDNNAHIDALKRIARIIGDPEKLESLENAKEFETVKEIIGSQ
jgi:mannitol operon transcriptional antiterminator